ncbi:hypothetical protein LOC67_02615 [Stieleria sp. JC731]|uniref:hypothetical protein n=1 Tax=Pirellulaceae TaxID=2691357 RepID=UPI001E3122E2|nr:hypothetical protein [Stieleria sp. JC731]MCC9599438.1 hypothetical protein [Stieleria sp. JC731]
MLRRIRHANPLESAVVETTHFTPSNGYRKQSRSKIAGVPLYDIAFGPDANEGKNFGHARGIIAIGDVATGVIALGGIARGVIAIGGLAIGLISLGGCAIGLTAAVGGLAIGTLAIGGLALGLIAIGGAALGIIAIGGGSIGYYACGGAAIGKYTLSGFTQDPEAITFFQQWLPNTFQDTMTHNNQLDQSFLDR